MMIDTHCHLNASDYDDVSLVIDNMKDNIIVVSMANIGDLDEVMALCEKYPYVYATVGLHPECADSYTDSDLDLIEGVLSNPKVVGIGEVGLDYHYTKENKDKQIELFVKQIELANKYNKTLVIHTRDAIMDTYDILTKYKNDNVKCNIHCFGGSLEMAEKFVSIGCTLGIGGVLTFKNEKKLKNIVEKLDISNFVLETDSPYLTPEPYRGKRNEPRNIYYVAMLIAELKGVSVEYVLESTTNNAVRLFDLNI